MSRVFHGLRNIANVGWQLSRTQRKLGIQSDCYAVSRRYGYQADFSFNLRNPVDILRITPHILTAPFRYDIFHFHYDLSLIPFSVDVPLLKTLDKKVFFLFHGCDVRNPKVVLRKYPYSGCRECDRRRCSPFRNSVTRIARQYADAVFYTTPDLAEFLPGGIWLPVPIDLRQWSFHKPALPESKKVKIAHAPTNRSIKGTKYLQGAVEELNKKGYDLELILIENMSHQEVQKVALSADIAVDQLLVGIYGLFSVEMMALGKPVICYIRDDLKNIYPASLPVISADPSTITAVLEDLINRRDEWSEIGRPGRDYVEKMHEVTRISRRLIEYYTFSPSIKIRCHNSKTNKDQSR